MTDLGIDNANTEKRERLITAEVESNNNEVKLWADQALDELKESCQKASDMFGIELSVDWRFREEDSIDEGNTRSDSNV